VTNLSGILVFGSFDANDGTNTVLLTDIVLGAPRRIREQLGGPGIDIAAAGALDESSWVNTRWQILIKGSSTDDVLTRIAALSAELRDLSTITVGLKGSAYTGSIIPKNAECVEIPLGDDRSAALSNDFWSVVEVRVEREPWAYGATEALYSATAKTLPCVLDLSAMIGDAPGPLDLLLVATSVNLHNIVAGVYPEDADVATFVRRAVALGWSGGAAAADAAGYPDGVGNTLWSTTSSGGVYTDLNVADLRAGSYALHANVKRAATATAATIDTPYGTIDIESTSLRRQLVGIVSLPATAARDAGASTLRVTLKGDGTNAAYVNTLELVPVSWAAVGWHHSEPASAATELAFEGGVIYADSIASLAYKNLSTGRGLLAKGGTLFLTGEATTAAPTLACEADLEYEPRWEQLPAALWAPNTMVPPAYYTQEGRLFVATAVNHVGNGQMGKVPYSAEQIVGYPVTDLTIERHGNPGVPFPEQPVGAGPIKYCGKVAYDYSGTSRSLEFNAGVGSGVSAGYNMEGVAYVYVPSIVAGGSVTVGLNIYNSSGVLQRTVNSTPITAATSGFVLRFPTAVAVSGETACKLVVTFAGADCVAYVTGMDCWSDYNVTPWVRPFFDADTPHADEDGGPYWQRVHMAATALKLNTPLGAAGTIAARVFCKAPGNTGKLLDSIPFSLKDAAGTTTMVSLQRQVTNMYRLKLHPSPSPYIESSAQTFAADTAHNVCIRWDATRLELDWDGEHIATTHAVAGVDAQILTMNTGHAYRCLVASPAFKDDAWVAELFATNFADWVAIYKDYSLMAIGDILWPLLSNDYGRVKEGYVP
jgi:hypothetical protein